MQIDNTVTTEKRLKYLGVWFDYNMTMREHVKKTEIKPENLIKALGRTMPNIGGWSKGS